MPAAERRILAPTGCRLWISATPVDWPRRHQWTKCAERPIPLFDDAEFAQSLLDVAHAEVEIEQCLTQAMHRAARMKIGLLAVMQFQIACEAPGITRDQKGVFKNICDCSRW